MVCGELESPCSCAATPELVDDGYRRADQQADPRPHLLVTGMRGYTSEGGHGDFAPGTPRERELLGYLQQRFGHVSWELVCSGMGIPNLYDFLADTGMAEPEPVAERIATAGDRTRAIIEAGLDPGSGSARCAEVLELFAGILGAEAGNMALTVLATGGIYLAGGIPPAILPVLRGGPFLARLHDKGRLSLMVAPMPVSVVTGRAALVGAAAAGLGRGTVQVSGASLPATQAIHSL